ncbi:hypothetical protein ILUMI_05432 [Ignelater luminosus]|uniref:PiggyBac transposable element-derived protein domain-containing protein n=1 Tax=Ignelater luminosus TaxID=2038154 RepID=A0A8K0DAI3_IGNLU|nr:hypothetical protein ILUMI_05432 [Ignelater luminosus]
METENEKPSWVIAREEEEEEKEINLQDLLACDQFCTTIRDFFQNPQTHSRGSLTTLYNLQVASTTPNLGLLFSIHIYADETMVPFHSRHGIKQHIHGEPIRFRCKLWSAATRNGYLITFEPYQDAKSTQLPRQDEYGLGAGLILDLESRLPKEPYHFYFDKFYKLGITFSSE